MTADHKILSAEELDAMTPDQRAAAFDERIVHDLDELPHEFRKRIMDTGRRLGEELRSSSRELPTADRSASTRVLSSARRAAAD